MVLAVTRRPATPNPIATQTAMHIIATDVDKTDEVTNAPIGYYLSAEQAGHDAARSVVFSGDFVWDGWVPPLAGLVTVHLRKEADDAAVAQLQFTAD